jgi:hypothetical protein
MVHIHTKTVNDVFCIITVDNDMFQNNTTMAPVSIIKVDLITCVKGYCFHGSTNGCTFKTEHSVLFQIKSYKMPKE